MTITSEYKKEGEERSGRGGMRGKRVFCCCCSIWLFKCDGFGSILNLIDWLIDGRTNCLIVVCFWTFHHDDGCDSNEKNFSKEKKSIMTNHPTINNNINFPGNSNGNFFFLLNIFRQVCVEWKQKISLDFKSWLTRRHQGNWFDNFCLFVCLFVVDIDIFKNFLS